MDRNIGAATKLRYLANSVQPSLLRNGKVGTKRHSIFIKTVRHKLLFSFGTFDSFLAGLGRNRVYRACCSAQTVHKPVQQTRQQVLRAYCPYMYTLQTGHQLVMTIFGLAIQSKRDNL